MTTVPKVFSRYDASIRRVQGKSMVQIHPNWETRTHPEPRKSVVPTTKERPSFVSVALPTSFLIHCLSGQILRLIRRLLLSRLSAALR
jgi:hypothetical protein